MAKRSRKRTSTRTTKPARRRTGRAAGDNLAGTKLDGKTVRGMNRGV